ncbi:MAG: HAMP domain-containing histidine kinase [Planctomycetes bacterium]|nr:HAMP domain-containing histidine kinase [Planctomycetota bacterium]
MASITGKRLSLHKYVEEQKQENDALKSKLAQIQHLANTGTISYMIAHEFNNLLTPLRNYAAVALENPDDKSFVEKALQKTVRNCERATKIMESMLALANGQTQEKKNARLLALVEEIFTCLCRDFAKDGITVEIRIPEELTVRCVPVQIQQVIMNLILNARDAMLPRGGILCIKATEKNDAVKIEVSDTGEGIEPADLKNIFDSFFTTKTNKNTSSEYSGAGLGLAFCKKIIEEHEGMISVESKSSKGSKFKITLPKPQ